MKEADAGFSEGQIGQIRPHRLSFNGIYLDYTAAALQKSTRRFCFAHRGDHSNNGLESKTRQRASGKFSAETPMNWYRIDLHWAYSDLLSSIYRQTRSMDRAYDVLHDSLLKFAAANQHATVQQPHAYLRSVIRTILYDQNKDRARWMPFPDCDEKNELQSDLSEVREQMESRGELQSSEPSPEFMADLRERLRALQDVLNCLPPRCREVFRLFHIEGLKLDEIARQLGISSQAVGQHLKRALIDMTPAIKGMETSRIDEEAAIWFMRMKNADPGHPDYANFDVWLLSDPAHAKAYAHQIKLSTTLGNTATATAKVSSRTIDQHQKAQRRRFIKGSVLSLLLAGGTSALLYRTLRYQPLWRAAFQTGVGEIIQQSLQDGSTLVLGGDTAVRLAFSREERAISLLHGEAIFDVAREPDRPFIIDAGLVRITVLGTRFAVSRMTGKVRVSLDHGRVELMTGPFWDRKVLILTDGQVAEITGSDGGVLPPRRVEQAATNAFAFQNGTIIFDNASLSEIAETLSRYRPRPVRLGSHVAKVLTFNAVARLSNLDGFLATLRDFYPIIVTEQTNQTILDVRH